MSPIGFHHTEESKKKMSLKRMGFRFSNESRKKMSDSHKGKQITPEQRIKISNALKGRKHTPEHNKKVGDAHRGKILTDAHKQALRNFNLGKHQSEETINKRRMKVLGKPQKHPKRHPLSIETKRKISLAHRGKRLTEEHKLKLKIARARQKCPLKDTSIELILFGILSQMGIFYKAHQAVKSIMTFHQFDAVLPFHNIVIEADGCYWHGCPIHHPHSGKSIERDNFINESVKKSGWIIIRFWEHDLKNNPQKCFKQINKFIFHPQIATEKIIVI